MTHPPLRAESPQTRTCPDGVSTFRIGYPCRVCGGAETAIDVGHLPDNVTFSPAPTRDGQCDIQAHQSWCPVLVGEPDDELPEGLRIREYERPYQPEANR